MTETAIPEWFFDTDHTNPGAGWKLWYSHVLGKEIMVYDDTEQVTWNLRPRPPEIALMDPCQQTCHGCGHKPREFYEVPSIAGGVWHLCPDCLSRVLDAYEFPYRHRRCPECHLPFHTSGMEPGRIPFYVCPFGHEVRVRAPKDRDWP